MNKRVQQEMIDYAVVNPTEEICGIMYITMHEVKFYPCKNVHPEARNMFEIGNVDYLECLKLGQPVGFFHSHIDVGAGFTDTDIEAAEEWAMPYYVYSLLDNKFNEYIPKSYHTKLEGKNFILGQQDCYSLVRNYYRQELGIYLRDFYIPDTFLEDPEGIVEKSFISENFTNVVQSLAPQKHDLFVYKGRKEMGQHFAIFIGNNRIIHHPLGRLSKVEQVPAHWLQIVKMILRHKNFL